MNVTLKLFLVLLCYEIHFSKAISKIQGRFQKVTNCKNHAPPSSTVFFTQTRNKLLDCMKDCLMNIGCRSFAYNKETSECHLSRSSASNCGDLQVLNGALTYKIKDSDLIDLQPDLYLYFNKIEGGKILGDINATIDNNPVMVDGVVGKAISFNGVDQWADLGTHDCFGDISVCTNGYSMTIWMKVGAAMLDPAVDSLYIISSGGQTQRVSTGGMTVLTKFGELFVSFRLRNTSQLWKIDDVTIAADQWFHLGVTWDKDGDLIVYINGEETRRANSEGYGPAGSQSSVMHIGKSNRVMISFGDVKMDEWYFWERVLEAKDMKTIYTLYWWK